MGYNRTVCMLSVTSVDMCLNSHLGVNEQWGQSHWGMFRFCGICGRISGGGGVRTRKQIEQGGQTVE